MTFGLTMDFVGYIVPSFNFVLSEKNPYIDEAEGDRSGAQGQEPPAGHVEAHWYSLIRSWKPPRAPNAARRGRNRATRVRLPTRSAADARPSRNCALVIQPPTCTASRWRKGITVYAPPKVSSL